MTTVQMPGQQPANSRAADAGLMHLAPATLSPAPGYPAPLSPATLSQAALFFAESKATIGGSYNFATSLAVRGPVTDDELVAACHRITAATPALRLRFGIDPYTGQVGYWFSSDPPEVALSPTGTEPARQAELATREPFEVDDGPLVRFLVLRHAPDHATLVMVTHHLCVDGLAHARLVQRLAEAVTGSLPPDPEAAYDELVQHVRSAEDEARETDLTYWSQRIPPDLLTRSRLPCDGDPAREAGRYLLSLDPAEPTSSQGPSTFITLVAAVHRALPPDDTTRTVVCVAASQRRPHSPDGEVIGSFVNQVPLVGERRPADSAAQLVARNASRWSADLRHRNFPFIDLAGRVQGMGTAPRLDSVMVGYRRSPRRVIHRNGDVDCEADLYYAYPLAKTELSVRFFHYANRLECEVQHGEQLSDGAAASFVDRLCREWSDNG